VKSFNATIDLPINMTIEAEDEERAETEADSRFAEAYDLIEQAVKGWRSAGVWPLETYLGNRYDDTEVSPA
jgi:hypothetical protein